MTDWITIVYALLPQPNRMHVLAHEGRGGIDLPILVLDDLVGPWDTSRLKPEIEEKIGVPINILFCVSRLWDQEAKRLYCIQLLEPCSEAQPPNALWRPLDRILERNDMPLALREGLKQWLNTTTSGAVPERRAPWALPGWYAQAEEWISRQASRLEREVREIQPVKSWSISCVLKVETESGNMYFKAARNLPLFVNEGILLTHLADIFLGRVPVPLAVQPEQGWMLLDNFGDAPDEDFPVEDQARLMRDFAYLQLESSRKVDALLAAGCKDRRLDILLSQIEPLLNDELALGPLMPEERQKLRQSAPRLRDLIADLMSLPIPYAILHGDLHAGNVVPRGDSFVYFDWTDAAISHPFFDMIHIFRQEDPEQRAVLQEAYLGVWETYYPNAAVRRAWELAGVLYGLYHAVSYQYIAHGIEELVVSELNFAYYFLRKVLAALE